MDFTFFLASMITGSALNEREVTEYQQTIYD